MTLGLRGRLVAVSLLFFVVGGLAGYAYLDSQLHEHIVALRLDPAADRALRDALFRGVLGGGAIAIAVALFMSFWASHLFARELRSVVTRARTALGEKGEHDVDLATLRGSIKRLTSELERSVSSLATERDRLRAVVGGIGEGVLALDDKRRVIFANDAAERTLGRAADGRALAELIRHPEALALAEQAEPGEVEVELPGSDVVLLVRKGRQLATGGFVLVLLDVSDQRRLERVRRDFVANVSHELRTPISVIRTNAEALADGALERPERAKLFVERTLRHAERLSSLVDDLLDLARLESGAATVTPAELDLRSLAERAVSAAAPDDAEVQIELEVERVRADPRALERALVNLIENAFRHGGDQVRLTASAAGDRVYIEVHDDGPGVPLGHRERIFERFYRVDEGRARAKGGTGIGLAIVKHLALVQGGRAGYRPGDERGSVFWLELPADGRSKETGA